MANPIEAQLRSPETHDTYTPTGRLTRDMVTKTTIIAIAIVAAVGAGTWILSNSAPAIGSLASLIGAGGLVVITLVQIFSKKMVSNSMGMMTLFAVLEGLMAGGFSYTAANYIADKPAGAVVGQALIATVCVVAVSAWLYRSGTFVPSAKVRNIIRVAGWGFFALYAINFVATLVFGMNFLFAQGPLPIIVGVVAVVIAAVSIIDTLMTSDELIAEGAGEEYRFGIATAIMADVVWMYIEIVRIIALSSRN